MISLKMKIKRTNIFIIKKISGETVIFDIQKGTFYQLNSISEVIWRYLWKERTVEEIIDKIVNEFNVNNSIAKKDIIKFINNHKNDLLVITG